MSDKHEHIGYIAPNPIRKGFLGIGRKQAESTVMKSADGTRYMFIITSNSYEDREGETITTKALEQYVRESWPAEDKCITNNKHLYWHDDNIHIGDIIWCDMQGPFLIELSKEIANEFTQKTGAHAGVYPVSVLWDYFEAHPEDRQGASHRFKYFEGDRDDATYEWIKKEETTTLPLRSAANGITFSGVIDMTHKDNELEKIVGIAGIGKKLRDAPDQLKAALDELGVQHKALPPEATATDATAAPAAMEPKPEAAPPPDEATALTDIVMQVIEANNQQPNVTMEQVKQAIMVAIQQYMAAQGAAEKPADAKPAPPPPASKALATDDLGRADLMAAVKELTRFNNELVDTQAQLAQDLTGITKALEVIAPIVATVSQVPEALMQLTGRIDNVEKQVSGRPRIASQDAATQINMDDLSPDLKKSMAEVTTYLGLPVKNTPK